jgi:predicted PurR-regulated permease PerM
MKQQCDSQGQARAANTMRELEKAKRTIQTSSGSTSVFMRVALTVTFMYLIVISYVVLGITGPVFISVLFLVAFFVPYFYQALSDLLKKHRLQKKNISLDRKSPHAG